MSTGSVVLLLCSVILLGVGALEIAACVLLVWSARRISPAYDLQMDVDALTKQYERLRGQKARATRAAKEKEPAEETPWYADLPPNEKALFAELEREEK